MQELVELILLVPRWLQKIYSLNCSFITF